MYTDRQLIDYMLSRVSNNKGEISFWIDSGSSVISTGAKNYVVVPYNATVTSWELVADQSGSIVIDVWKDVYANFPPTVADTLIGGGGTKPTLSSAQTAVSSSLSNWTTSITAGDYLKINVDSVSTVTKVLLTLKVTKI